MIFLKLFVKSIGMPGVPKMPLALFTTNLMRKTCYLYKFIIVDRNSGEGIAKKIYGHKQEVIRTGSQPSQDMGIDFAAIYY